MLSLGGAQSQAVRDERCGEWTRTTLSTRGSWRAGSTRTLGKLIPDTLVYRPLRLPSLEVPVPT